MLRDIEKYNLIFKYLCYTLFTCLKPPQTYKFSLLDDITLLITLKKSPNIVFFFKRRPKIKKKHCFQKKYPFRAISANFNLFFFFKVFFSRNFPRISILFFFHSVFLMNFYKSEGITPSFFQKGKSNALKKKILKEILRKFPGATK